MVIIDMTANNTIPIMIAFRRDSESPVNRNISSTYTKQADILTVRKSYIYHKKVWANKCMHVNNTIYLFLNIICYNNHSQHQYNQVTSELLHDMLHILIYFLK